jgi:hypothetical protein
MLTHRRHPGAALCGSALELIVRLLDPTGPGMQIGAGMMTIRSPKVRIKREQPRAARPIGGC